MRSTIQLIIVLLTSFNAFSQPKINIDSLANEICNTVKNEIFDNDSLTIINGMLKHLNQFRDKMEEKSFRDISERCFFRLQRECPQFKNLLDKIDPPKGDWKTVDAEPKSSVSKEECQDFFKISSFKYLEASGDTADVVITNSTWTDHLRDGTFSKLSLLKTGDCEFVITFIESNNLIRKSYSVPGDRYRYKLLKKMKNYYEVFVEVPGQPSKKTFKLYY